MAARLVFNIASSRDALKEIQYDLLLPLEVLDIGPLTTEGQIVTALTQPWLGIIEKIGESPEILHEFSKNPRLFEEFVAATYSKFGYKVTLTPRSADLGRDVIAELRGFGAIRIIDQCKAFSKGHRVNPNDVRAIMGSLYNDRNASKAVITTTSTFAPSVFDEWRDYMPYRLELREGAHLMEWLKSASENREQGELP